MSGPRSRPSCILLTCDTPGLAEAARAFAARHFDLRLALAYPDPGPDGLDPRVPELVARERVDYLFGFLSPVIIPSDVLAAVGLAINFHPAPPRWPGIGGSCYALYNGDPDFGVTAHVMEPTPDTGAILKVDSFPILPGDDQETLLQRAWFRALPVYYDLLSELLTTGKAEPSGDAWERPPLTSRQLRAWLTLRPTDPPDEVERKIRAARHPLFPAPLLELHGHLFSYLPRDDTTDDAR